MKRKLTVCYLLFFLPFMLSLNPIVYEANYVAQYRSPEGIQFLSYSHMWDTEKLENLYKELLRNQHGTELSTLREVRVKGESHDRITGNYNPATNVITLYNGDNQTTIDSMRNVLSHEYGHHFAFYYIPEHMLPITTNWKILRGAENTFSISFWNYNKVGYHKWFSPEIIANDYVMLYGATQNVRNVTSEDVRDGTLFKQMTKHENPYLPNVLENVPLQRYLEEVTKLEVDSNRVLITPQLLELKDNSMILQIMERENIVYRFAFDYYEGLEQLQQPENWVHRGYHTLITTPDTEGKLAINLEETLLDEQKKTFTGSVRVTVEAVDLNTNLGLKQQLISLHYTPANTFRIQN